MDYLNPNRVEVAAMRRFGIFPHRGLPRSQAYPQYACLLKKSKLLCLALLLPASYFSRRCYRNRPPNNGRCYGECSPYHFIQPLYHDESTTRLSPEPRQPMAWEEYDVPTSLPADEGIAARWTAYGLIAGT